VAIATAVRVGGTPSAVRNVYIPAQMLLRHLVEEDVKGSLRVVWD
jgi:hypothetical protein